MRSKGILASVLVLGASLLMPVLPADAAGRGGGEGRMERPRGGQQNQGEGWAAMGPALFRNLDLTQEQRDGLKRIRQQHQETHKGLREQLQAKERALHEAMLAPATRREEAERLQREVSELRSRLALARVGGFFEMRALLTPEQLGRLAEVAREGKERRGRGQRNRPGRSRSDGVEGDQP